MPRLVSPLLFVALLGSGCAYVGQKTFEQKRDSLDQDGDGAPFGGNGQDCNDNSKDEAPGNDELPYDGLDNDCEGGDVVDADGDGFPGILRVDYEAAFPKAKWPASVVDGPIDCADDPTKYANAAQIKPGNNQDPPYDGIDQDCAGDNDFDDDGDGYVAAGMDEAFATYVTEWGYDHLTATTQFGDCNDFKAAVNPGVAAIDDAWYDGDDSDCAGNNDFDADADGFMWDQTTNALAYTTFVNTYHPDGAPWVEQWDDCLDQPDPSMAVSPDPADVFPGNPVDPMYDGIDSDCACDNDYDADVDGVMPDSAMSDFPSYLSDWGCTLPETYGDCDDADPITGPGRLELFGDLADSDCDGDPDGTPFGFGSTAWLAPRPPRVIRTTDHYLVVSSGEWVNLPGTPKPWLGAAMYFDLAAAGYVASPAGTTVQWAGAAAPLPLGYAVDAVAVGSNFIGATSYYFETSNAYLTIKTMNFNAGLAAYTSAGNEWGTIANEYTASAVDMVLDANDHPWALSCGPQQLQILRGDGATGGIGVVASLGPDFTMPAGIPSGVCFWEEDPDVTGYPTTNGTARIVVCDPGVDCVTYDFDSELGTVVESAVNDWAGRQLEYGQYQDGWHMLIETLGSGARLEGPFGPISLFSGWDVTNFDASWRDSDGDLIDDQLFAAAVATPIPDDGLGPRVVLSYGDIGGSMTEKTMDFVHPSPTMEPEGVGILIDDDRIAVAVSAVDPSYDPYGPACGVTPAPPYTPFCAPDALGWAFFGWP